MEQSALLASILAKGGFDNVPLELGPLVQAAIGMMASLPSCDIGNFKLRVEIQGMTAKFGPPTVWTSLETSDMPGGVGRVFDNTDKGFDDLVRCYRPNTYGEASLNPCDALDAFHRTCTAFISTLLGWKPCQLGVARGFLGNVVGFLGGVDKGVSNDLKLNILIWLNGSPPLVKCDSHFRQHEKSFRSQCSTPNPHLTSTVRAPEDMPKPSWNPVLLRLFGLCHDLKVFHSGHAGCTINKYIIYHMTKGPRRLFSDNMLQWLPAFMPDPYASAVQWCCLQQ